MPQVYNRLRRPFPLAFFLRASALHVGAAAAAASLRRDLVEGEFLASSEFDEAYAIARLTPGTNLLAMYTLLGKRLAGWLGATTALAAGALIPAAIAGIVAALYLVYAGDSSAAKAMQGARAGALAVLFWAVVRLLRPQLVEHRTRGVALAVGSLIVTLVPLPQIAVLLVAGGLGAVFLRREP